MVNRQDDGKEALRVLRLHLTPLLPSVPITQFSRGVILQSLFLRTTLFLFTHIMRQKKNRTKDQQTQDVRLLPENNIFPRISAGSSIKKHVNAFSSLILNIQVIFTLWASRSKLTEAVFTVSVDELTGYRQAHPIWDVLHCLDWRWSCGFP